MKKILSLFISVMLLLFYSYTVIALDEVTVSLDGEFLGFDVPAQIIDGRTMVPVRGIFEALGATVQWDGETQTAIATKDKITVEITINKTYFKRTENSEELINLDVPAQIIDGRTFVPARAIGEAFECTVDWVDYIKMVSIESKEYTQRQNERRLENKKEFESTRKEWLESKDPNRLRCSVNSLSFGKSFTVLLAGEGGDGNYKFRYEIYQDGELIKKTSYGKEDTVYGKLSGTGECIFKAYIKDGAGAEASKEIILNE